MTEVFKTKYANNDLTFDECFKLNILNKAMKLKLDNPRISNKEIGKQLKISSKELVKFSSANNDTLFVKITKKTVSDPQQCCYCDFIGKNISGIKTHIRLKHKKEIAKQSYEINTSGNVLETSGNTPKTKANNLKHRNKKQEKLGLGEEITDDELNKILDT